MHSKVVSLPHSLTKFAGHVRLTDRKTTTSPAAAAVISGRYDRMLWIQ